MFAVESDEVTTVLVTAVAPSELPVTDDVEVGVPSDVVVEPSE